MRAMSIVIACVAVAGACVDNSPNVAEPELLSPAYAKPAPAPPSPEVDFHFPMGVKPGISGDDLSGYTTILGSNSYSLYKEPICGVTTNLFNSSSEASGDMVMQTNNSSTRSSTCADYPRKLVIRYGTDHSSLVDARPFFMNLREISKPGYTIAIGATVDRILTLQLSTKGKGCSVLRFNPNNPIGNGATYVNVKRLDESTYHVTSKAGSRAYCPDSAKTFAMPVEMIVRASVTLP